MYDFEINEICASFPNFLGVFSRDEIPIVHSYPSYSIINTDKASDRGSHWLACRVDLRKCEYFDSFGLPPIYEEISQFIGDRSLVWNNKRIQSYSSKNCGAFCICFVKLRSKGLSFKQIIKRFSSNVQLNDNKAWQIIDDVKVEYVASSSFAPT